jgi:transposase
MRRPTLLPEETAEHLKLLLKQAKTKSEFQRIQAVYLRVATNMKIEDIADALGWHPGTVRNIQSAFLRKGTETFHIALRCGRRRENLSIEEEDALLAPFLSDAVEGGEIVVSEIKAAYEQKFGQSVHTSTVYRILSRHNWRKIVPRQRHPADIKAQDALIKLPDNSPGGSIQAARRLRRRPDHISG